MCIRRKIGVTRKNHNLRKKKVILFFKLLLTGFLIGIIVGFFIGENFRKFNEEDGEINKYNYYKSESSEASKSCELTAIQDNMETLHKPLHKERIEWDDEWEYASFSEIHEDGVYLYYSNAEFRKNLVVAVNAGHGTIGGDLVKTLCHPDGSRKVTGGSTAEGEVYATANSLGTTFLDGTEEAVATLSLAEILKSKLLENGYDVLMIRETDDCQIDNIARSIYANENADCHVSLHYDSTVNDKGFFYISVPNNDVYRSMEPVASYWREHNKLGEAILSGIKLEGVKVFGSGSMEIDLTQTSYSTIPSVDVEVGDRASDYSEIAQEEIARGILKGIDLFFVKD